MAENYKWIVISVTGVTGGGKSQSVTSLYQRLPQTTRLLRQDDYFLPDDSPLHLLCPGSCGLHNWDSISSVDRDAFVQDVQDIISKPPSFNRPLITFTNMSRCDHVESIESKMAGGSGGLERPILLLDGFCILDEERLLRVTDLAFFFTLDRETCVERRLTREYDPPDAPGYFDVCAWPMYIKYLERTKSKYAQTIPVKFVDGTNPQDINVNEIFNKICSIMNDFMIKLI